MSIPSLRGRQGLSDTPLERFVDLPGVIVHVSHHKRIEIRESDFAATDVKGKAVLVHTGWSDNWATPAYFESHSFLTEQAAVFLRGRGAVLVGIDSHNIDDTRRAIADPYTQYCSETRSSSWSTCEVSTSCLAARFALAPFRRSSRASARFRCVPSRDYPTPPNEQAWSSVHTEETLTAPAATYNRRMAATSPSSPVRILIEPLRKKDVGELLTVQRAAFLLDAQLYGNAFLPSLTQTLEQLQTEASDPNLVFLVAKLGGRLVGSVRAVRRDRIVYISRLLTAPDVEGRGIGGSLLAAIEAATAGDADVFELTTGTKSAANIAMYQRRGYRIDEETTDGAGVRVVNMSKPTALAAKGATRL